MHRNLILIRGLPGSGKTTLASTIALRQEDGGRHWYVVEADMFWGPQYDFTPKLLRQAHEWCLAEATRLLYHTGRVIVSNTFTTMSELEPYLSMARHLGAKVTIITCNQDRGSIHNIPEPVLNKMKARWVPHELIFAAVEEKWRDVITDEVQQSPTRSGGDEGAGCGNHSGSEEPQ